MEKGNNIELKGVNYEIEKRFSRSAQSEVFLIKGPDGSKVIKLYLNDEYVRPNTQVTELRMNKPHPNILKVLDFGVFNGRLYELTEYCSGENLSDKMPVLSFPDLQLIISQIIEGLSYCHSNGILYLDMKPKNIFLKNENLNSLVFGDFGDSDFFDQHGYLTTQINKGWYYGPEFYNRFGGLTVINQAADYYALGITILELVTGENNLRLLSNDDIRKVKIDELIDFPDHIEENLIRLIRNLTKANPSQRWQYDEVKSWLDNSSFNIEKDSVLFYTDEAKERLIKSLIKKKKIDIFNLESQLPDFSLYRTKTREFELIKKVIKSKKLAIEAETEKAISEVQALY